MTLYASENRAHTETKLRVGYFPRSDHEYGRRKNLDQFGCHPSEVLSMLIEDCELATELDFI